MRLYEFFDYVEGVQYQHSKDRENYKIKWKYKIGIQFQMVTTQGRLTIQSNLDNIEDEHIAYLLEQWWMGGWTRGLGRERGNMIDKARLTRVLPNDEGSQRYRFWVFVMNLNNGQDSKSHHSSI